MSILPDTKAQTATPVVDTERPWPGLFPFTEQQSEYFFGRDDEIEELFRRVKRDTITVLYSKSGLGKSSLLQAGLFPRLRKAPFLPVYIRLKYDNTAGSLESQVKSALQDAIDKGDFAEVASPAPNEPLWEYLHRRGGNLIDRSGNVVCPVLVFDQFEEIFTLGESNETARQLREQFLICFADLAENSKPQELSERLADNSKLATQFDFSSAGCRFVVSLREEYVARLDDLRKIPSLASASSRMALKELNGGQALQAVSKPNPDLVTDEVSELIVRFVAGDKGGKSLSRLEVAPAILSLFCRELSIKRGDQPQITSDLVTGNADTIIDDFYKRCVDDKPAVVQRLIEDELVTESGYRNNVDLNDAKRQLEQAGVPDMMIDELVDERLLHIEDYRGKPRLELTHDVLLEPVKRRREQRRQKETQEKKEAEERAALAEAKRADELARVQLQKKLAEEQLELADAKRAHEKTKAKLFKKLLALACVVALAVLGLAFYALHQKKTALTNERLAEKARAEALENAASAKAAEKEALDNAQAAEKARAEAQQNADAAKKAEKEALASAQAAKTAEARLEKAMQQVQADKKQLADLSSSFLGNCDDIGTAFKDIAQEVGDPAIAELFFKLYEGVVESCVDSAAKLHKLDPDNIAVTNWLGKVRVQMAESAALRDDKEEAHKDCKEALVIADALGKEGNYKTQIVAARTYSLAGYLLLLLHDPDAVSPAEKGMTVVVAVQANGGANRFNAWDWDKLSDVYYYRGKMFEESKEYKNAIPLYQQSFDAESKAYAKDPDEGYMRFAMERAEDISNDARELNENDVAEVWHQKFVTIANGHASEQKTYSDALKILEEDKDYPAARVLIDRRIALLAKDQKALESKRQLADAYADSSRLSKEMNDWPRAVDDGKKSVDILLAARNTTTDPKALKKVTTDLAIAYGNLAWREIEAGKFQEALEDARKGLHEDPAQKWIGVNEAHALLFTGQIAEAKSIYMELKDETYKDRKLVEYIQDDFRQLCVRNLKNPEMADIARDLGINDPKLEACLASPTASK